MNQLGLIRVQGRKATKEELDAISAAYARLSEEKSHATS